MALKIEDEGNIATIAPKLYINTKVDGMSVMVVGVEPEEESKIKTWWKIHEGQFIEGKDQALVGAMAAEILRLKVGDNIPLNGSQCNGCRYS